MIHARNLPPCSDDALLVIRHILEQDEAFMASSIFREQCARACDASRIHHTLPVPFQPIASIFGINDGALRVHWTNFRKRGNDKSTYSFQ
jgi:hypothetical protein